MKYSGYTRDSPVEDIMSKYLTLINTKNSMEKTATTQKHVDSFEEACERLGRTTQLPDFSMMSDDRKNFYESLIKLETICEAENGDWRADWIDYNQKKWFPWFRLDKINGAQAGFAARYSSVGLGSASSSVVSRLCLKDEETCDHVRDTFTDLWIAVYNG